MGSTAWVRGRNQNEHLRELCTCKASTQRSQRISVTSVFRLFSAAEDTEKGHSARYNNAARTRATGERRVIMEGIQRA
jgi:hypothetical protein